MSAPIELSVNIQQGRMYNTSLSAQDFTMPIIYGETKPLAVTLVADDAALGKGRVRTVASAGIALTVALLKIDGTTVLTSTLLVAIGDVFYGDLLVNTQDIFDLVKPYDGYLFFDVVTASRSRVKIPQRIESGPPVTITPTVPPDVGLGAGQAAALFVPRDGGVAGQGFFMIDQNGDRVFVHIVDRQLQVDPVS